MFSVKNLQIVALFLLLNLPSTTQVVINEFCTANYSNWGLSGEFEDWIELYNAGASNVDITGYWLSDDASNPQKWAIPAGTLLAPGARKVILLSGTGTYDPAYLGQTNASFKVTQTDGESVVFSNPSGTVLESYSLATLGPLQANHSYGRSTDGANDWIVFTTPTPNAVNTGSTYNRYAAPVIFSAQAGYYGSSISLTLTTTETGASIYYTTNGSTPNASSALYSSPISLSSTTVIRAIAISSNGQILPGFVETNTYFFGTNNHGMRVVSASGDQVGDGDWGWTGDELMHIEVFGPGGVFLTEASGDSNEHGNDSNAYGQRGFDYVTRDALGYDNVVQYPLFHVSDRPEYERVIFKAAANDNYPFEADGAHIRDAYVCQLSIEGNLHLDERKTEHCIVYLNGQYWGVYEMREKVDDSDYTDYYYNQSERYVDFIKTWGSTWNDYGTATDWNSLVAFITSNDMTVQANYDYVLSQYNHMSLIDYFILNGYVVCTDWLNWNTSWWRGRNPNGDARRWRYALWDNDATFGHYINYTGVPSTDPNADPCQIEDMGDVGGQGHIPVLNALFNNESFLADYVQRYATLSNTIFSCERMNAILDSMVNVIAPEMQGQVSRWGGDVTTWQANVQAMRDFIDARCNDEIIGGISNCYNVTPFIVTVQVDGVGEIQFSDVPLNNTNTPWSGTYFADLAIRLEADGDACGTFAGWEIVSGTGTIEDPTQPNTTLTIQSDVTIVAHFVESTGFANIVATSNFPDAGQISVNGTPLAAVPQDFVFVQGENVTFATTTNDWYTFDHWESNSTNFDPNNSSTTVTFSACTTDTIEAIFISIPNATLTVDVSPRTAGTVSMDGTELTDLAWTNTILANQTYNFQTTPTDIWSVFDHWEIHHNTLSPDNLSNSVSMLLMQTDTLVAVYRVIPHFDVTVVVDPPGTGEVIFANSYSTTTDITTTLAAGIPFSLKADANEYYDFKGFTSVGNDFIGNPALSAVQYNLSQQDTIIAHFEKQPFAYYVPNSFSPNGDGLNEVFKVEGNAIDIDVFELAIYNRWGEKVFETTDITKGWEGDYKKGDFFVRDDIYNFTLKIKSVFDTSPEELRGTITIFR